MVPFRSFRSWAVDCLLMWSTAGCIWPQTWHVKHLSQSLLMWPTWKHAKQTPFFPKRRILSLCFLPLNCLHPLNVWLQEQYRHLAFSTFFRSDVGSLTSSGRSKHVTVMATNLSFTLLLGCESLNVLRDLTPATLVDGSLKNTCQKDCTTLHDCD